MIIHVDNLHLKANQNCSHNVYGSFYLSGKKALLGTVLVNDKADSIVEEYIIESRNVV